jgi:protein-disulfide isomerase-like protein with CxxC motif
VTVARVVTRAFEITWDYRCPFARNAHEHVIEALEKGADWDVTFVPFSLGQVHVAEGQPDVWDAPESDTGLLALQAGVVVRDKFPDRFLAVHRALFALRHDEGGQLKDEDAVRRVLESVGVDADAVFAEIASGRPLQQVKEEHTVAAEQHKVWGVPTFIQNGSSVFVRLMNRPQGDADLATTSIERVLDLLSWPELNEFKHTSIPR